MMSLALFIIKSWLLVTVVHSLTAFNNSIQDEPEVECGHGNIIVNIKTALQVPSYIFAKGFFRKDGCLFKNTNTATFNFEQCNVNRKREVNPRGMAYSLTVIVQLHPLFITKVDRAYNVRCFYMEDNREVDAQLQVSDLTTATLDSGHAMPQCSYTLHGDSPDGPVLRYAKIGDLVYHVWDCPSDVYAMLVHSCSILDGQGGEHKVIDPSGCSIDDFIIPQITYSNELTRSFTAASVVNLPDRESIYFSCQVKLCFKKGDFCTNVTPPKCKNANAATEPKHVEEDLRHDQLLRTQFAPSATSKPLRIISASSSPNITDELSFNDLNATKNVQKTMDERYDVDVTSIGNTSEQIADFPVPPLLSPINEDDNSTVIDSMTTIEGSGEDDDKSLEHSTSNPLSESATRERRTVSGNNLNIVDLDVSTPQLKILEDEFDLPELPMKLSARSDHDGLDNVCISIHSMWILSAISVVSITVAIASVGFSRLSKRKAANAEFYHY